MPSLYLKRNDGTWCVPTKVYAKDGTNTWKSCSRVFRNDAGYGWVKHWPPTTYFSAGGTYVVGPVGDNARNSWTAWREIRVPEAYRTTQLCHLTSFTINMFTWWTDRDDNTCRCDGGIYQYSQINTSMQFATISPNIRPVKLGTPVYSAVSSVSVLSSQPIRTTTLSVSHTHVLLGIRYRVFYQVSGNYSGHEFQILTAPLLDATSTPISSGDIDHTGGYASAAQTNVGADSYSWGGASTCVAPNTYTARSLEFGTGFSGNVYRVKAVLTSQYTKID